MSLPGYVHLLPDFLVLGIVQYSFVLVLGWCWVHDADVPCHVQMCRKDGIVIGNVVQGPVRGYGVEHIMG